MAVMIVVTLCARNSSFICVCKCIVGLSSTLKLTYLTKGCDVFIHFLYWLVRIYIKNNNIQVCSVNEKYNYNLSMIIILG